MHDLKISMLPRHRWLGHVKWQDKSQMHRRVLRVARVIEGRQEQQRRVPSNPCDYADRNDPGMLQLINGLGADACLHDPHGYHNQNEHRTHQSAH